MSLFDKDLRKGGKQFGKSPNENLVYFQEKYGKLVRIPWTPGRPTMVLVYDPHDMETIYRNEGQWPHRFGLEIVDYWRNQRKDIFKNFMGLTGQ